VTEADPVDSRSTPSRAFPWLVASAFLLGFGVPTAISAQATLGERLPVVRETLANGMRVIVLPRRSAPTVAFVVRYTVGGVNESRGTTGVAHLLEHLLFKGTSTVGTTNVEAERVLFREMDSLNEQIIAERSGIRPDPARITVLRAAISSLEDSARTFVVPNEFDRILSTRGARGLNATTDSEATTYFVELPANVVELWFAMEADRMRDPVFREFYVERDVIAEERRLRTETQPGGLVYEMHLATAYQVHPYGQPVVGYMSDIQALTRPAVTEYYRKFYGANNAIVTIVGDIEPTEVLQLVGRYFSDLPRGESPPPVLAVEPEQRGERRAEIVYDAEPHVRIGWHVVDVAHEDMPALIMLSSLLTGGRTGRLYNRLVLKDRLAAGVMTSIGPGSRFPQLFSIDAFTRAPHTAAELEAAIYEELDRLRTEPVGEVELQRIRNGYQASQVRRLTSNLGLALQLADSEALFGDWSATFRFTQRIQDVTPEDVQRVVATYFRPENRTVVTLVPAAGGDR
jgi:predicted Zn-dependent peptidase